MKSKFYLTLAATLCFCAVHAQSLSDKTMIFYGIDFSKARMIGDGFGDANQVKGTLFKQWNELFTKEADKYDLRKAFNKEKIELDLTNVEKNNEKVNTASLLMASGSYKLSDADAESVLSNYSTGGKTGLGCVFVIESFDKVNVTGTIHFIFFDVATHKILLHKRLEEKAGGFGLRAYWAKSIYLAMDEASGHWKKWLKGK